MFSIEAIPCLTALPLQARLGLLFSFCLVLASLNDFSPSGGNAGFHLPGLRWCRSPTPPSDRPQIAAQGRVWFLPACWRISGGSPSLSEIPYKNSGRRKKHLCHAFGNPSRLSSLSRASVFQNRREKIAFLCLAAQILRCHSRTPGRMLHGIFAHKQRTRPVLGRVLISPHSLAGRLTPPCLAPICTPRPRG